MTEDVKEKVGVQRYSDYKDSGVVWLGIVPSHWEIEKGKWLFKENDRPTREEDEIVTCFRDGEVTLRSNRRTEGFTNSLKEHGYQGVRKGDLVIHNMDAFAGAIGVSDSDGKSTPVYSVCTPKTEGQANPYYYAYFLRDLAKSGFIESLEKGIRERSSDFRFNDFGKLLLPLPPAEEQRAIANFLSRKTAKIDQVIESRKKIINRIFELINIHVLSGELPRKDGGSIKKWEDIFPKEWEMEKGKRIFEETNIKDNVQKELLAVTQDHGIIYKSETDKNYVSPSGNTSGLKLVQEEDYVISLRSFEGGIETSDIEGIVSPAYNVFRLKKDYKNRALQRFYQYLFKTPQFIRLLNTLVTSIRDGKNISFNDFSELTLPRPKPSQVSFLLEHMDVYERAKIHFRKEEKKLKEYKTSLTNSAVTGKIKVS